MNLKIELIYDHSLEQDQRTMQTKNGSKEKRKQEKKKKQEKKTKQNPAAQKQNNNKKEEFFLDCHGTDTKIYLVSSMRTINHLMNN